MQVRLFWSIPCWALADKNNPNREMEESDENVVTINSLSRLTLLVVGIAIITVPIFAAEDDPNEGAIKARRAMMTLWSWYAGPLFQMAKGDMEYNAEVASVAAANLKMVANADESTMWPEGSDNTKYKGKTRALSEGWTEYDAKYGEALVKSTTAMADAAGNGLDARCAPTSKLWANLAQVVTTSTVRKTSDVFSHSGRTPT